MDTRSITFGVAGLVVGGIMVGIGATVLNKPVEQGDSSHSSSISIEGKTGDEYDQAFLDTMIAHHEMATEMAKQSAASAKHDELKQFSNDLLSEGEAEIKMMKQWQADWGYAPRVDSHTHH